jgi:hypothetical protein
MCHETELTKEVWKIRIRLQLGKRLRELALFNLAIDSKLRGCDLVKLKVRDVAHGDQVSKRAMVMQQKTHQPIQFEITEPTRASVMDWIKQAKLKSEDFLFPVMSLGNGIEKFNLFKMKCFGYSSKNCDMNCKI